MFSKQMWYLRRKISQNKCDICEEKLSQNKCDICEEKLSQNKCDIWEEKLSQNKMHYFVLNIIHQTINHNCYY